MFTARERSGECNGDTTCPVCSQPISGSPEELNEHVEYCLSRVEPPLTTVERYKPDVSKSVVTAIRFHVSNN